MISRCVCGSIPRGPYATEAFSKEGIEGYVYKMFCQDCGRYVRSKRYLPGNCIDEWNNEITKEQGRGFNPPPL